MSLIQVLTEDSMWTGAVFGQYFSKWQPQVFELEKYWTEIGEKPWCCEQYFRLTTYMVAQVEGEKLVGYVLYSIYQDNNSNRKYFKGNEAGLAAVNPYVYIHKIVVHEEHRRNGVAQNLLEKVVEIENAVGISFKVRTDNAKMIAFCKKNHFLFDGIVKGSDLVDRYVVRKRTKLIRHARPNITDSEIKVVTELLKAGRLSSGVNIGHLKTHACQFFGKAHCVVMSSATQVIESLSQATGKPFLMPAFCCPDIYANIPHELVDVHPNGCMAQTEKEGYLTFGISFLSDLGWQPDIHDITWSPFEFTNAEHVVFSMGATKLLGAGNIGLYLTNNLQMAAKMESINRGQTSDLHAVLAIEKLINGYEILKRRADVVASYSRMFGDPPLANAGGQYRFVFWCSSARQIIEKLNNRGVEANYVVDSPILRKSDNYPVASSLAKNYVSLPVFETMSDEEVKYVVDNVKDLMSEINANNMVVSV